MKDLFQEYIKHSYNRKKRQATKEKIGQKLVKALYRRGNMNAE